MARTARAGADPAKPSFEQAVARSSAMSRTLDTLKHVAAGRAPVLLEGERGTGKRWLAEALHRASPRAAAPFVACGGEALRPPELERELFGSLEQAGALEAAAGGTLLLDDVHALDATLQARLLRFVIDREFERAGDDATRRADVRLVVATCDALDGRVATGLFREDLFQRLAAVRVRVPALRERAEDFPLLVHRLLDELAREHRRPPRTLTVGVLDRLASHHWPGNIRELRGALEGMVVFAGRRRALSMDDLPLPLRGATPDPSRIEARVGMTVEEVERALILATLIHATHDKPRAAAMLGIGLRTLYRKLRLYGLS